MERKKGKFFSSAVLVPNLGPSSAHFRLATGDRCWDLRLQLAGGKSSYPVSWISVCRVCWKWKRRESFSFSKFRLGENICVSWLLGYSNFGKDLSWVLLIPIDRVPSRNDHCFLLSLSGVSLVKRKNHRVACRHRSYKSVAWAGLTDWWVHGSHQTGICLGSFAVGPLCKSQLSFSFCLVPCADSLALWLVRIFSLVSAIWEFTSLCVSGGLSSGLGFWDVKSQIACFVVVRLCQLSGEFVLRGPSPLLSQPLLSC